MTSEWRRPLPAQLRYWRRYSFNSTVCDSVLWQKKLDFRHRSKRFAHHPLERLSATAETQANAFRQRPSEPECHVSVDASQSTAPCVCETCQNVPREMGILMASHYLAKTSARWTLSSGLDWASRRRSCRGMSMQKKLSAQIGQNHEAPGLASVGRGTKAP